jgi:hypothetical protein
MCGCKRWPLRSVLGNSLTRRSGKKWRRGAELLRGDAVAEPQRRGKGKESETLSLRDALSAMRLASHYPKTLPLPSVLPRREKRNRPQGEGTAVSLFNEVRLGAIAPGSARRKILGEVGHNEFDRYAARGRKQFRGKCCQCAELGAAAFRLKRCGGGSGSKSR